MGTHLPKNPQGNDSPVCFGPGDVFGDVGTPAIIRVKYVDWIEDAFWEEKFRDFLTRAQPLYQTGNANVFVSENDAWKWSMSWGGVQTVLWLNYKPRFPLTFQHFGAPVCSTEFLNQNFMPGGNIVYGGSASFTWHAEFDE